MDALQLMAEANDKGFKRRVKYFMQKAAAAVLAEAGSVSGHDLRAAYANKVLVGSASELEMAMTVVTNSTIAAAGAFLSPDSDIEFAVNSFWDAFAGVTAAEVV